MFQLTLRGLLSLLLVALPLCATAFSLKGKVIDRETGDALIGATLTLSQIGRTTLTDNEGLFRFELPSQRNYTRTVSYLGYRKQTLAVNPARTDTLLLIYGVGYRRARHGCGHGHAPEEHRNGGCHDTATQHGGAERHRRPADQAHAGQGRGRGHTPRAGHLAD